MSLNIKEIFDNQIVIRDLISKGADVSINAVVDGKDIKYSISAKWPQTEWEIIKVIEK
jgi:hypothetical protein